MTLEDLLRTEVDGKDKDDNPVKYSPEFRVAVQSLEGNGEFKGVHILIHPNGHSGETLDFLVNGNDLTLIQ